MADPDDLLKNAGKFFRKLGGQLKDTAQAAGSQISKTTKQVTGLGRGAVKLELDQTRLAPGGALAGRVVLALTEPVQAKRLVVTLRARQKHLTVKPDTSGKTIGASHADVYQLDRELGGATTYQNEAYPFELAVPADALDLKAQPPSSALGEVVRKVATAVSPEIGPVEWQVVAELEIEWGRNLRSEVDVVVA
jgi:hypothetical protein